MPNELLFHAEYPIPVEVPEFLGRFSAEHHERIRVFALCPFDAVTGVAFNLVHFEDGGVGQMDEIALDPGASVSRVYEAPSPVLSVNAWATGDPSAISVWVWGYRGEAGTAPQGQLQVIARFEDENGVAVPAGPGILVTVGGIAAGVTDADGVVALTRTPGMYEVTATIPSTAYGETRIAVGAGVLTQVFVTLNEQEIVEPADLIVAELVNGALPLDSTTVTLRLEQLGVPVPLTALFEVELRPDAPNGAGIDMTDSFQLDAAGTMTCTDVPGFLGAAASMLSDCVLTVTGADVAGFTYAGSLVFVPGVFVVRIQLEAPPSQPALPVAGLPITIRYGGDPPQTFTSDAAGVCDLSDVPGSMLDVKVLTTMNGLTYTGWAVVAVAPINGNPELHLLVRLLGLTDFANGVVPWELTASSPPPIPVSLSRPVGRTTPAEDRRASSPLDPIRKAELAAAGPSSVTVAVVGAAENTPVTQVATLPVAKGTEALILRFSVSTAEYPTYVMQQSRYNDTWALSVRDSGGGILFELGRAVNSQLGGYPAWGPFGDTGTIQEEIDVAALTQAADTEVTLLATTTNIGDEILPTDVVAILGAEPKITINDTQHDIVPTVGASDRFSIPRPGETNALQRIFTLPFTKPDDVEITKVKAELLCAGVVLETVVNDEAPGTTRVQQIGEATMQVTVTYETTASTVASTPPPGDRIVYRFTFTGTAADGTEVKSDPKDSAEYYALWRMQNLPRYGSRVAGANNAIVQGGDDWCAEHTYNWLAANPGLVTRIDDVSGEHGRNLGHQEHATGLDIDMFHVYTFPNGAASGGLNYQQLAANVQRAIAGDAAALARVDTWATDTRAHFDNLINDADVNVIRYAIGSAVAAAPGLPALGVNWARDLLRTGNYQGPAGVALALPAGPWANGFNGKLRFDAVHNSHFHVDLG